MKTLEFYQDTTEVWDDEWFSVQTVWFCTDGISTYFGDTKAEAAAHFGVPVGFDDEEV